MRMVAVHADLLPIATVHGLVYHARLDLKFADGRRVNHNVDISLGWPQVLVKRHAVVGQASEYESAVTATARYLCKAVLVGLETLIVGFRPGDADQVASRVVSPTVVPALKAPRISPRGFAYLRPPMAAAVDQQLYFAFSSRVAMIGK